MKYIYAFDLSLNSPGISIFSNDNYKPILVTSVDTRSEKEHQTKLKMIANKFLELKEKYEPERIVLEGGFSRFNASTQAIYKVWGICQYIFCEYPQTSYPPLTVKKVVGGKGNMKKDELRKVVQNMFKDLIFKNDDESDSLAVGICYLIKEKGINFYG